MLSRPETNADRELWVIIASPDVQLRVNGETTVGLRALVDRDEIRMDEQTFYFSTERLASVVAFAGPPLPCARCKLQIQPGSLAVSCPNCSLWHHQSAEYPCWTYADYCSICPCGTDLTAGYQWTPEEF
jgi:hypothetical protein